ncbi:PGF-CTERM sorting domain-containing protein [Natronorubrum sp. FCH18a]|uniref:PGF-CTERM sorting domain-containing protein n=1 Tax=Natronorubrum sp. FCH18a TaxID=3447018 RepID=UPI003F512A67
MGSSSTTLGSLGRRALLTGILVGAVLAVGALAGLTIGGGSDGGGPALESGVAAQDDVSEDAYEEPVPEEGDLYHEETADDGSWISYVNPRDEYRDPYLDDGSGKICVTLVNEAGEPVVGESVPNTSVTIPTGEPLDWHSEADPFVVEFPMTDHYTRPLDADQFGTNPDLPHGDGTLDSHCLEWHGLPEDETVEYGEAELEGAHADDIELVGYVQQTHEAWDADVDPIADAESYDATEGGWTYHPDGSHGQTVVVLQLNEELAGERSHSDGEDDGVLSDRNGVIGVGAIAALVALAGIGVSRYRR